jgi:hypothetical protein
MVAACSCKVVLFSSTLTYAASKQTDTCNVERLGSRVFGSAPLEASVASQLELQGWVVDQGRTGVPFDVSIRFVFEERIVLVHVRHRILRPDIVEHFRNENLMLAGFVATVAGDRLGIGTWRIAVVYRTKDAEYVCDNGRAITLRGVAP